MIEKKRSVANLVFLFQINPHKVVTGPLKSVELKHYMDNVKLKYFKVKIMIST